MSFWRSSARAILSKSCGSLLAIEEQLRGKRLRLSDDQPGLAPAEGRQIEIHDPGREEVDLWMDLGPAVEHGAIEMFPEPHHAARNVDVDVNPLVPRDATPELDEARVQERLEAAK